VGLFGPVGTRVREHWGGAVAMEVGAAMLIVATARAHDTIPPEGFAPALLGAWVTVYLGGCVRWPYRKCWWPWCMARRPRAFSGSVFRLRRGCRICHGEDLLRIGARLLMGAGRDDWAQATTRWAQSHRAAARRPPMQATQQAPGASH
jgi:hypothetical protein